MSFAPKTISERRGIIRRGLSSRGKAATTDERLINSRGETRRGWSGDAGTNGRRKERERERATNIKYAEIYNS